MSEVNIYFFKLTVILQPICNPYILQSVMLIAKFRYNQRGNFQI